MSTGEQKNPSSKSESKVLKRPWSALISLFLLVFLWLNYLWKPDATWAITIWPFWVFSSFGVLFAVASVRRGRWRIPLLIVGAWIVSCSFFSDETVPFLRGVWPSGAPRKGTKVITLNCAGGDPKAAGEAFQRHPDVILFQESPTRAKIIEAARLAGELGWYYVIGPDASIASRFPLENGRTASDYALAFCPELKLEIVSLRLQPPILRFDYWSPECWHVYADSRIQRHREFKDLVGEARIGSQVAIMGGDFNTPPDGFFSQMEGWTDVFHAVGRGWGDTATNDLPMVRIDQIWIHGDVTPVFAEALETVNSDHRMVEAVLQIGGNTR